MLHKSPGEYGHLPGMAGVVEELTQRLTLQQTGLLPFTQYWFKPLQVPNTEPMDPRISLK